jgi:hypothetical protein
MRGFLILGTILGSLVVWLFWAAPSGRADSLTFVGTQVEWQFP